MKNGFFPVLFLLVQVIAANATSTVTVDIPHAEASKYVIITTAATQSGSQKLLDLVESKKKQGFDTEVITESVWGGNADALRNWLKTNYAGMGIKYVLLIGNGVPGTGDVPMYDAPTPQQDTVPTDFYYCQLSGNFEDDGDAEVSVGRIPVYDNDFTALDNIIEKVIHYENQSCDSISWRQNALLIAKPYDPRTPGSNLFEACKEKFIDSLGWDCFRIYDDNTGNPDISSCTQAAVTETWSSKTFGLVEWMTHGTPTDASSVMSSAETSKLGNAHTPIVFMGSDSNGKISTANNLSYEMLRNAAIASVAGTHLTSYTPSQTDWEKTASNQGMLYEFCRAIVVDSLGVGDALNQVKRVGNPENWWINICSYNVYGCPDIGVYSCAKPYIDSVTPMAGEVYKQGDKATLTWKCNFAGKVRIDLLLKGTTVDTIVDDHASKDSYTWTIPDEIKDAVDYTIMVTEENEDVFGVSGEFIINMIPVFTSSPLEKAGEEAKYLYEITAADSSDLSGLEFYAIEIPSWLSLADNGDGTADLSGTPAKGAVGEYKIKIGLCDEIITDTVYQEFTLEVEVLVKPQIANHPENTEVNVNTDAGFSIEAIGHGLTYVWQIMEEGGSVYKDLDNETEDTLVYEEVKLSDDGAQFRCIVSNPVGEDTSDAARLTVKDVGIKVIQNSGNYKFNRLIAVPNPVRQNETINFSFNNSGIIEGTFRIYDPPGNLIDRIRVNPGDNILNWDVTKNGAKVSTGTYLAVFQLHYTDGTMKTMQLIFGVKSNE